LISKSNCDGVKLTHIDSLGIALCQREIGVALRLPPQSKFVDGLTCQLATFGRDLVVFMAYGGENWVCF
jgi:hypothetical protein